MLAQTPSKDDVQGAALLALTWVLIGTPIWIFFTMKGPVGLGVLRAREGQFLFVITCVITVALAALSFFLWRAAHRLPPLQPKEAGRSTYNPVTPQGCMIGLVIGFVNILSFALGREELSAPLLGLLLGSSLLLAALRSRSRFSSLTHNFGLTFLTEVFQVDALYLFSSLKYVFGLLTVLGSVAALALDFGGVSIWITIVGLGNLVICWLTVLHMLFVGRRMLHLAVSRSSSESRR